MPQIIGQKFPPYVFREYPKWVTLPNGKKTVVNSEAEELDLLGTAPVPAPAVVEVSVPAAPTSSPDDEDLTS